MAEDIDKLIERLDDKCHRLICMVFADADLSTEDPRIDDFADDRGQGPDTINLCIDSGLIKQVGSADEGENFRLVPGWWPHSLPSEWRRLILGSLKQSCDIQSLRSRVSELEAERDRALRNRDMWKGQSERQAERLTAVAIPGPAASTASDDLVTEIAEHIPLRLHVGHEKAIIRAVLSSPPVREIVEALNWYAEHVAACRKITREGDTARADLDRDGGNRARSILSRFQSVGGEKHDHADGTSAEAVEKITQVDERRQ